MFHVDDLSKTDLDILPDDVYAWQFFDIAPYDSACVGPRCKYGPTAFLHSWGDVIVFACSAQCVVEAIYFERARQNALEVARNAAYTVIPVGENGSYKVIKPKQERMF